MSQNLNEKPSFSKWTIYKVNDNTFYYYNKLTQETTSITPIDYTEWFNFEINVNLKKVGSIWRQYKNESGRIYYHNKQSNITQWDIPQEVLKYQKLLEQSTRDDSLSEIHQWKVPEDFREWMINEVNRYLERSQSVWKCVQHKDGRLYFYHQSTRQVQWNKPDGVSEYEKFLTDLYVDLLSEKLDYIKENYIQNINVTSVISPILSSTEKLTRSGTDIIINGEGADDVIKKRKFDDEVVDTDEQADRAYVSSSSSATQRARAASDLLAATSSRTTTANIDGADDDEDDYYNYYFYASGATTKSGVAEIEHNSNGDHTPEPYDSQYEEEHTYDEDDYGNYGDNYEGNEGMVDYEHTPVHGGDVEPYNEYNEYTYEGTVDELHNTKTEDNIFTDEMNNDNDEDPTSDMTYEQLQTAKYHLSQSDCLMDRNISDTLKVKFALSNEPPLSIVKQIAASYTGYAQMTLVVLELMKSLDDVDHLLKSDKATNLLLKPESLGVASSLTSATTNATTVATITRATTSTSNIVATAVTSTSPPTTTTTTTTASDFDSELVLCTAMSELIKEKFDRNKADALIHRLTGVPEWLSQLIKDPIFRCTLIEMYEANRSSTLLGVCLREISALGHHREISKVIREVEYFDVFNNMILEIILSIMTTTDSEVVELASDWRRMNFHSEYMFLYSNWLLEQVEKGLLVNITAKITTIASNNSIDNNSNKSYQRLHSAWCRIRRLRQGTENEVVWEKRDGGMGRLTSSAIMALRMLGTFSEANPYTITTTNTESMSVSVKITKEIIDILKTNTLLESHIEKLYSFYFNTSTTATTATTTTTDLSMDQIQYFIRLRVNSSKCIYFLQKSQLLSLFVDKLVDNIRPLHTQYQKQLIKLLSVATTSLCDYSTASTTYTESLLSTLLSSINNVSQSLSTMVDLFSETVKMSYGVISYDKITILSELLSIPIISICTLRWITLTTLNSHYNSKSAYLTILPVFFHLITVIAGRHPLQLPDCFQTIIAILTLSSSKGSSSDHGESSSSLIKAPSADTYTLTTAQKDAVEVLVYIMGLGYTLPPLDYLLQKYEEFDAVTLRHILQCVLASIQPPFSTIFLQKFELLLNKNEVQKAISSVHFKGKDDLKRFYERLIVVKTILMGVSYVGQRAAILSGIGPLTYNACRFTVSSVLLLIFRPCLQHLLSTSEDNDNDNNEQTCDHNQYSDESSPLVLAVGKDTKPYTKPIINTTKVSSTIYSDSIQSNHTTTDTYNVKTCINVKNITTNHQTSDNSFQDTYNNDYKYNTQPSTSIMKKNTRTWYNLLLFGSALGITNFLGSALFQIALVSVSVTTAGFITSLYVVFVPIVECFIPGRRNLLKGKDLFAAVLSVVGLYVLSGCSVYSQDGCLTGDVGYGEILVFISVFCWVGSIIAADMGMDCTDGVSLTCVEFIMCAILNIIVAIVFEPAEWTSPYTNTKSNWQFILLVGVTEALAFLLSTVGQRYTSASRAALLYSMESLYAADLGYLFLDEILSFIQLIGCAIVFVATIISSM